jgi:hypothetical protein
MVNPPELMLFDQQRLTQPSACGDISSAFSSLSWFLSTKVGFVYAYPCVRMMLLVLA